MALITKSEIATVLNVADTDIVANLYSIAKRQFFTLTGLKEAEIQKTFTKFIGGSTSWLSLGATDIKSIDTLTIDDVDVTVTSTSVKFNPDSGLVTYLGGFYGKVVITYTINAYTPEELHDYLMILLVVRQLSLFRPTLLDQISSFTIGRFKKTFGSASKNQGEYLENLYMCIDTAVNEILGDDGQLSTGSIR